MADFLRITADPLIQLAPVKHLVGVDPMRLRHCRNRHPGLPRLFHNEPLLLRRPELTDPSSSNNRLSRFHRVPRTHGIKPCLQRACRKKNALSRRPTVDAYSISSCVTSSLSLRT